MKFTNFTLSTISLMVISSLSIFAQDENDRELKPSDLSAPKSPGFQLIDLSPTNIESPAAPQAFVVGVLQSMDGNSGWPLNYSMEVAPYWWVNGSEKSAYSFLGIKREKDGSIGSQQIFSGLKFTSISASFVNKDMIPDTFTNTQKIFSIGFRTTVMRVYNTKHIETLKEKINNWSKKEIPNELLLKIRGLTGEQRERAIHEYWKNNPDYEAEEIADIAAKKPIFQWDIAGAYATYGINDQPWNNGRNGVWTTLALNLPLETSSKSNESYNYVSVLVNGRYLNDNYARLDDGRITESAMFDMGAKIEFQIQRFSLGFESMYRYYSHGGIDKQVRNVGTVNYKIDDNLYLSGTFGENFGISNKTVALFGLNWGFGSNSLKP